MRASCVTANWKMVMEGSRLEEGGDRFFRTEPLVLSTLTHSSAGRQGEREYWLQSRNSALRSFPFSAHRTRFPHVPKAEHVSSVHFPAFSALFMVQLLLLPPWRACQSMFARSFFVAVTQQGLRLLLCPRRDRIMHVILKRRNARVIQNCTVCVCANTSVSRPSLFLFSNPSSPSSSPSSLSFPLSSSISFHFFPRIQAARHDSTKFSLFLSLSSYNPVALSLSLSARTHTDIHTHTVRTQTQTFRSRRAEDFVLLHHGTESRTRCQHDDTRFISRNKITRETRAEQVRSRAADAVLLTQPLMPSLSSCISEQRLLSTSSRYVVRVLSCDHM